MDEWMGNKYCLFFWNKLWIGLRSVRLQWEYEYELEIELFVERIELAMFIISHRLSIRTMKWVYQQDWPIHFSHRFHTQSKPILISNIWYLISVMFIYIPYTLWELSNYKSFIQFSFLSQNKFIYKSQIVSWLKFFSN